MIRLDSTLRKIEVVLAAAVATTQPAFTAGWSDATSSDYVGGSSFGVTNSTTPVTLVAAPASAGIVRDIDNISLTNRDSAPITVTVNLVDNVTSYPILTVILAIGDNLIYTHSDGWKVVDKNGNTKTSSSGGSGGSGQMIGNNAIKAIAYNSVDISEDLTLLNNTNGLSAGPVTINNGYSVTVPNGSVWSIV